ncbi:MAG: 50S ribosomal protein L29 [Actinobacteria bacterium]|nr:50S ribosomal protein L29 [Actinomycetota bacterium]
MVKARELRDVDDGELVHRLTEAREELFNLRFQLATGQLDNFARLSQLRKDIARLNTFIRQREIEAAENTETAEAAEAAEAAPAMSAATESDTEEEG